VDDTSARLDRPLGIIFDLDGTLADTLPVCFDAYRLAFAKYVARAWTDDQISALFGPSEEGVIRQVVPTRAEECLEDYLRHYGIDPEAPGG
jgi:pyrophosphatase PpaX